MTWLWVLPLVITGVGLAGVAVAAIRATAEVVALRARADELRSVHAEVVALRRDAAAMMEAAEAPALRPAPRAESPLDGH